MRAQRGAVHANRTHCAQVTPHDRTPRAPLPRAASRGLTGCCQAPVGAHRRQVALWSSACALGRATPSGPLNRTWGPVRAVCTHRAGLKSGGTCPAAPHDHARAKSKTSARLRCPPSPRTDARAPACLRVPHLLERLAPALATSSATLRVRPLAARSANQPAQPSAGLPAPSRLCSGAGSDTASRATDGARSRAQGRCRPLLQRGVQAAHAGARARADLSRQYEKRPCCWVRWWRMGEGELESKSFKSGLHFASLLLVSQAKTQIGNTSGPINN